MRTIEWNFETDQSGSRRTGEIEVEDDATDEEIEEAVSQEVFNYVSWGWVEKEPSNG